MPGLPKITPCLWFDSEAEEAAREAATRREAGSPELEPGMQRRVLEDNVLVAPARFMQAVSCTLLLVVARPIAPQPFPNLV